MRVHTHPTPHCSFHALFLRAVRSLFDFSNPLTQNLNDSPLELQKMDVHVYFCSLFVLAFFLHNRYQLSVVEFMQFGTLSQDHKAKVDAGL